MRTIILRFCLLVLVVSLEVIGASAQDRLKIGAVLGLTGTAGIFGQEIRQGMELCHSDNSEILVEDSQGQPVLGLSAFKKLVDSDKINIAVVSFTGVAGAILPVASKYHIPIVLTLVSSRSITKDVQSDVFRFFTSGEQEAPIMARFLTSQKHHTKAAILNLDDEYGLSYRNSFAAEFEKLGGRVVFNQVYSRDTADFRTALTRLKASGAESVYLVGHDSHLLAAIRQSREMGVKALIASNWILASPSVRKGNEDLLENVVLTSPSFYWSRSAKQVEFRSRFHANFGKDPTAYAGLGCDVVGLIERYPLTKLVISLRGLRDFEGILGQLTTAPDGSLEFPLFPAVIHNGQVQSLGAS